MTAMIPARCTFALIPLSALLAVSPLAAQSDKSDAFGGSLSGGPSLRTPAENSPAPRLAKKSSRPSALAKPKEPAVPFDGLGSAPERTERNGSGGIRETVSTGLDGRSTTRRDARGRITATGSTSGSNTTYRDVNGRILGNVTVNGSGSVARNVDGKIQYTTSTSGSTTTFRDRNGRILGTKEVGSSGSATYRNANGRITGPDFR